MILLALLKKMNHFRIPIKSSKSSANKMYRSEAVGNLTIANLDGVSATFYFSNEGNDSFKGLIVAALPQNELLSDMGSLNIRVKEKLGIKNNPLISASIFSMMFPRSSSFSEKLISSTSMIKFPFHCTR